MFAQRRSLLSLHTRGRDRVDFFILIISFVLQFHSVFASPPHPWQPLNEVGAAGLPGQYIEMGYECGNVLFSDSDINEARSLYYQHMNQNSFNVQQYLNDPNFPQELDDLLEVDDLDFRKYLDLDELDAPLQNVIPQEHQSTEQRLTPIIYYGPLYSDSASSNYILWPIQKEEMISSSNKLDSSNPYYIVIRKNDGQVIDVISKTKNYLHTKCIRLDGLRTVLLATAPDMNNGYQCAHEFLSDDLVQKSLGLCWGNNRKNSEYPAPFVGRLYPAVGGYKIWPIFSNGRIYDHSSVEAGPYFIVIDRQGNLVGAVVEGLSGNFLRCPRSVNFSKIPPSYAPNHSQLPKKIIKSGYYCGRVFFNDNAVEEAVNAVRNSKRRKPLHELPYYHKGPQFDERIFLWPLMRSGILYKTGSLGVYRVALTSELNIRGVGMIQKGKFKLCERGMVEEEKDHEKSNFLCIDHVLTRSDLEDAAKRGCDSFLKRSDRLYPALYKGPEFDKSGPYFTYPVCQGGGFVAKAGRDRVVINSKCEIVGALTITLDKKGRFRGKEFVLCIKSHESSAERTHIKPAVPISEHRCGNSRRNLNLLSSSPETSTNSVEIRERSDKTP